MKKTILLILLCISLLELTACKKTPNVTDMPPAHGKEVTPGEANSPTINRSEPTHMTKKLCDGLEIDADIPISDVSSLPTYQANPLTITPNDAIALFLSEGKKKIGTQTKDHYDPKGFLLTMKGGQEIFHRSGQLSFDSGNSAKDQDIFDVLQRYGRVHPQKGPRSLSFMSPKEAVKQGEDLIQKLGLISNPDIKSGQIVGLKAEEIMNWQKELLKDSSYKEGVDIGKTTILNDLDADDDAYLLTFSLQYQDIPIFNQDNEPSISSASDGLAPPSAKAAMLVTAKGLRYFSLEGGVSANGTASKPQAIISADKALSKLVEKYEDTIRFGKQCITEVWLEYIPQSDNNTQKPGAPVTLTPYWCFRLASFDEATDKLDEREYDSAERFNAITGKDLAYGG
ncbi:hypothetical protein [Anaerocolumna sp. MB42-C2]|uniref:hypothetical protein n=1 Tax=Anaerocolumna sp. MB42-C2 TaxID=3070997 RepID=UPI0027DF15B2|nr:hypothetical protein [Anaerocolumna sp. MB42-C2]WMJ89761.1 hypothetical protein RBU59_09575 [Anaerocolumna sp. MB42-C2]